jgi:hypothetical protein
VKRILRVFPKRTSLTPDDPWVVVGVPDKVRPPLFDEVHVSCTFTWNKAVAERLGELWREQCPRTRVVVGGPAFGSPSHEFVPGRYVRYGISISSRGCPNSCDWCYVPKREGKLRLLPICPGNDLQDNNITAWPRSHWDMLVAMLESQTCIRFSGGLEAARFRDWHVDGFKRLRPSHVREIWFAADTDSALRPLAKVAGKMLPMFDGYKDKGRRKLRCYVMIGRESLRAAEARLECVWGMGFLPFAQLFQDGDRRVRYNADWRKLERKWARPAAMFACHG